MIEINLVPPQIRRKKKSRLWPQGVTIPPEVLVGSGGGLIVLLILVHISLIVINIRKMAQHQDLQRQWGSLLPSKGEFDSIVSELRILQGKQKAAEGIFPTKKILWSQKLNILSDDLPRGVWLRKVSLDEGMLFIEGSAVFTENEGMINVHKFTSNLKGQVKFLEDFTDLELGSIQRRKIKHMDIADFIITARLQ
jgi:hypothetical protein